MKHKVSELTGALLDAAVAKAANMAFTIEDHPTDPPRPFMCWVKIGGDDLVMFLPGSRWRDGGPIIERERIVVSWAGDGWFAGMSDAQGIDWGGDVVLRDIWSSGPTPLIAAMRAFVASKFGEEVDL